MSDAMTDLAKQVIANMSDEMRACFITASVDDQTALAAQLGIESLRKNLRMQVAFQTNPEFRKSVESAVLAVLA